MPESVLAIDQGTTSSRAILFDWAMQFLAGILGAPVDRPVVAETTVLGVAWLAGMRAGLYSGSRGVRRRLGAGAPVRAGNGGASSRGEICGLEGCRQPHSVALRGGFRITMIDLNLHWSTDAERTR